MAKGNGSKVLIAVAIAVILIAGAATFYILFFTGDQDPSMSMRFSDKVLVEAGSTEIGMDHSVESLNQFAVDMYKELSKNSSENVFFSPLSLYIALSMAMEGAKGETFTAMRDALRIVDDNTTRRGSFASIQNDLNSRKGCELSLVNNVWVREDVVVKEDYNETIRDYYMASIEKAPFASDPEGARKTINERISDHTHGRIDDLIPPGLIDEYTAAILTNAIYFKGQWKYAFDPKFTMDRSFALSDGSRIDVPMMCIDPTGTKDRKFYSSFNETLDALRLDYGGGDISMLFMLPGGMGSQYQGVTDPMDIDDLDEAIDHQFISDTNSNLVEDEISVTIPKFSFETDYWMNDPLIDLGMGIAFDPILANFSGLKEPSPFISDVLHKAFISVDESGTEAAAATAVVMQDASALLVIELNHPFVFLVQDNETGLILFMGRVMDPTK